MCAHPSYAVMTKHRKRSRASLEQNASNMCKQVTEMMEDASMRRFLLSDQTGRVSLKTIRKHLECINDTPQGGFSCEKNKESIASGAEKVAEHLKEELFDTASSGVFVEMPPPYTSTQFQLGTIKEGTYQSSWMSTINGWERVRRV